MTRPRASQISPSELASTAIPGAERRASRSAYARSDCVVASVSRPLSRRATERIPSSTGSPWGSSSRRRSATGSQRSASATAASLRPDENSASTAPSAAVTRARSGTASSSSSG